MARGRRTLNRKDLRAAAEAAERRDTDEEVDEEEGEEEDEDEDEDEEEGDEEKEAGEEEEPSEEIVDEDEEEARPKKKAKPKAKPKAKVVKPKAPKRVRTPKTIRQKALWIVYNNSHSPIAKYEYRDKADADAHVARLNTDKKTPHFVQLVKEPWEEKKE